MGTRPASQITVASPLPRPQPLVTALQRCAVIHTHSELSSVEAELLVYLVAFRCTSFSYRTFCGAPASSPRAQELQLLPWELLSALFGFLRVCSISCW